jgi:hypothetical protein
VARGGTTFKIKGLKRWLKALNADDFDKVTRKNLRIATALNGKVGEALLRKAIQSGAKLKPNARLTKLIKRSKKPLVDQGLLFQSVTSVVHDDFTVFVGVLRKSEGYNLIETLHEGKEIKVTPEMRGMFFMLWRASIGEIDPSKLTGRAAELWKRMPGGWKPLAADTVVIIIPSRPFIRIAFSNTQMIKQVRDNWKKALAASFAEQKKNAGPLDEEG